MLLLGHLGITLGTAVLLDAAISKRCPLSTGSNQQPQPDQEPQPTPQTRPSLLSRIDLRLLLTGSLLPDIIDKPVGDFLFRDTFNSGRIFGHTLLFLILITLAGFYLYRHYRKTWLLVLSFGTLMHLIFDQMWAASHTLLWPLYDFAFRKTGVTNVIEHWFGNLHNESAAYVPEIIGAVILGWFFLVLVRRRKVYAFIRHGQTS